ncbi:MAG: O-methyltransferase [Clostridia bacterium]
MNEEKQVILEDIKIKAKQNFVPILQDASLDLILMVLKLKKPNQILEIGTAVGYSAIKFSENLSGKNSKITTIELKEDMYNQAISNIAKMGLEEKIDVIHADAITYLEKIDEKENKFDVIFIDAAKGQYMVFLKHALRLIASGGVIIADNILFKGRTLGGYNEHRHRTATTRLREYLKEVFENDKLDSKLFQIGDGVVISIAKE